MSTIEQPPLVSDTDLAAFGADGVVCLRQVIDADWLQVVAAAIDDDIAEPGPFFHGYDVGDGKRFHGNLRLWEVHEGMRRYCLSSPLPAAAQALLDSKRVNLFYDQLFVKESATDSPTRWHNDQPTTNPWSTSRPSETSTGSSAGRWSQVMSWPSTP